MYRPTQKNWRWEYSRHITSTVGELNNLNEKLQNIKRLLTSDTDVLESTKNNPSSYESVLNLMNFYENLYCSLFSEISPLLKIVQIYVISFESTYDGLLASKEENEDRKKSSVPRGRERKSDMRFSGNSSEIF